MLSAYVRPSVRHKPVLSEDKWTLVHAFVTIR